MSLFQCEHCGCCENTALTPFGGIGEIWQEHMDWSGIEDRQGKKLCSACSPTRYTDGTICEEGGKWHNEFERTFLPLGMFKTNRQGNLEHIGNGDTDFRKYEVKYEGE